MTARIIAISNQQSLSREMLIKTTLAIVRLFEAKYKQKPKVVIDSSLKWKNIRVPTTFDFVNHENAKQLFLSPKSPKLNANEPSKSLAMVKIKTMTLTFYIDMTDCKERN
ncbi:CLUMA_CG013055, isoform A [Clunio marinus]|uniref:CLUMA_CG013055, isoform A n=1 Tax=Clunio marinus TaxID=568069 RepID=A0A1J1IIZ4_9DIPT|nr:CLUMA_CG013055, isoform A [Clunio marinus]